MAKHSYQVHPEGALPWDGAPGNAPEGGERVQPLDRPIQRGHGWAPPVIQAIDALTGAFSTRSALFSRQKGWPWTGRAETPDMASLRRTKALRIFKSNRLNGMAPPPSQPAPCGMGQTLWSQIWPRGAARRAVALGISPCIALGRSPCIALGRPKRAATVGEISCHVIIAAPWMATTGHAVVFDAM